ncbi:putative reverse transcriptase domain-containing protein [Tanacetum coccineum]
MKLRARTRVFRLGPVWGCDRLVSRAKVIENQLNSLVLCPAIILGYPEVPIVPANPIVTQDYPCYPEVPIVPVDPLVAPDVGTVLVISPAGVLDLLDYSSSFDSDPSEYSSPHIPDLPLVSPSGSSSHDALAPLLEFPLAPIVASPRILRPIPACRLAWRRVSYHSSDRHSSPDSSSSSSPLDHSLSGLTPLDTTDTDTSTPPRFVHRSLARTPRRSEAFRRWRSAPLSTPYLPTTSDSSLGSSSKRSLDSSSLSSRPSHKRSPTPADLLPHRKSFRDSYSPEDSGEEHMEVDTTDAEAVVDVGISKGVVAYLEDGVGMGFEITASYVREDDEEFEGRGYHLPCQRTMTITRSSMTPEAIEELVNRRVKEALAAYEETRAANALEDENQSQNSSDDDNGDGENENGRNGDGGNGDGGNGDGGNGDGGNGNGGNGNPNENGRGDRPNSHKRTIGTEAAFVMSWRELIKLITDVYCPRNEIQKMESELWNLTVKNNDLAACTQRFQELTTMCTKMVQEEEDRVEKFIGGLPDNI